MKEGRLTVLALAIAATPLMLSASALLLWSVASPVAATRPAGNEGNMPVPFEAALALRYEALAQALSRGDEAPANNWADAQYFALKAMAAERGEPTSPERLEDWTIDAQARLELEDARDRLLFVMARNGRARDALAPDALDWVAEAQVQFDCWVERAEENRDEDECRLPFEQAMLAAEAAADLRSLGRPKGRS